MRRNKHRPRRVLLGALALFALSQFALGLWLDHGAPLFRFASLRTVLLRLENRGTQPLFLVLGSSRLEGAFQEREAVLLGVNSLFNAAVPAGDPTAQEVVLDQLIIAGVRPQRILLEVCPEFFTRTNFCAGWNGMRLHRWADLPQHLEQIAVNNHLGRVATARLVPAYSYRDLFWQECRKEVGPWTARPLELAPAPRDRWQNTESEPIVVKQTPEQVAALSEGAAHAKRVWLADYQIVSLNVRALDRLIAKAQALGAEVWLVTPPLSHPHRALYTPAIESAYQALLERTGCHHVDCRDWMGDEHFVDSHHLNLESGRLFTRRFLHAMIAPAEEKEVQMGHEGLVGEKVVADGGLRPYPAFLLRAKVTIPRMVRPPRP